jgi:TIR domain
MPYQNHVFISYAHDNNKPVEEGGRGWVEQFQRALDAFLGRRYRNAKIWRDERLRGNDDFSAEIFDQFPDTALMVSVISLSYLESQWCRDEASKFCEIAQRPPGLVIDNKMRAFKVMLEPVPNQDPRLPEPMRDALGFEFYVHEGSRVCELDPAFGPEIKGKFNRAVAYLASEIADLLRKLESAQAGVLSAAAAIMGPTVYLAECSYDRREDRKALNAELRARKSRSEA